MSEKNTTEAINNLNNHAMMSVKYAATSDQKSLMCLIVNGNPKFLKQVLDHPKRNQKVDVSLEALYSSRSGCSAESLWERETIESLLINSSHALLRDWVVHGARVL